jgi:hypothetical protein
MYKIIYGLLLSTLFISCQKNDNLTAQHEMLIGIWQNHEYITVENQTVISFQKVRDLDNNQYAVVIENEEDLYENKNASFCGVGPFSFDIFKGKYTVTDELLIIDGTYWGGNLTTKYKIVELTNSKLLVQPVD